MNPQRRHVLLAALEMLDAGLASASWLIAAYLTHHPGSAHTFREFLTLRLSLVNWIVFTSWLLIWHVSFRGFGLYHSRRLYGRARDARDVCKAVSLSVLIIGAYAVVLGVRMLNARFLFAFWLIATVSSVLSRTLLRSALHTIRLQGHNLRNILIVGTSSRALEVARCIEASPELGYRILGFVDQDWGGLEEFRASGFVRVTDFERLPEYLRLAVVDEVVIALPIRSFHSQADRIAALCEEHGITIHVLSNLFNLRSAKFEPDELHKAVVVINRPIVTGWPVFFKRFFDIVISSLLLLLSSPLLLLAAALIKLTSPGPAMFSQYRVGLYKRPFRMYKLRTMIVDAEKEQKHLEHLNEVSGPVFKIKDDPRITPVGKFLRKTSIDELPQLINVLKGEMSLVGPRPLPIRDYEGFREDWHRRRFSVPPGITCLWQIAGRSSVPFEQWMQLDIDYIEHWSLWLDVKIIAGTIPVVFKGSGAA